MDAQTLARCTGATLSNAEKFAVAITEAMDRFEIDTARRQAAFLATVSVESMKLSKVEEDLYYKDAARLARIYKRAFQGDADKAAPYTRNPAALGKLLYNGYWGRGLIQLTWVDNYINAGKALGFDYVGHPELLTLPVHAALTAAWYWHAHDCNDAADLPDMDLVTERVNGPAKMHLAERKAQYQIAMDVLA